MRDRRTGTAPRTMRRRPGGGRLPAIRWGACQSITVGVCMRMSVCVCVCTDRRVRTKYQHVYLLFTCLRLRSPEAVELDPENKEAEKLRARPLGAVPNGPLRFEADSDVRLRNLTPSVSTKKRGQRCNASR